MPKDEKLPYMKYYPADLDAEPTLKLCSWEACFLWVKMFGLMHHSPQRGYLLKQNGKAFTEDDLVEYIHKSSLEKVRNCLFELESNAVFSRDRRGVIYCRKMVKGEKRAKNLPKAKTKSGDKSEIIESKTGDNSDLALAGNHGDIKEISGSGDRSVVKPEARSQIPESKEKKDIATSAPTIRENALALKSIGDNISEITGWASDPRWFGDYSRIEVWLKAGYIPELDIYPTVNRIMAKRTSPPQNLKYFEQAIADAHAYRTAPTPKGNANHVPQPRKSRSDLADDAAQRGLERLIAQIE